MADRLRGKRIAIVATDWFEQSELFEPQKALKAAGATIEIIAPKSGYIQDMEHHEKGKMAAVDRTIEATKAQDHARLVTSRKPGDLPAFCAEMIEAFGVVQSATDAR